MDIMEISRGGTVASVNLANGQLCGLRRGDTDVMWHGGGVPAGQQKPERGWDNSEIVMFPIVGRAPNDQIFVDGIPFPMTQHGLSRNLPWLVLKSARDSIELVQVYEAGQRVESKKGPSVFPRSFTLKKSFSFDDNDDLRYAIEIENLSSLPLPFSAGIHPAFPTFGLGDVSFGYASPRFSLDVIQRSDGNVIVAETPNSIIIYRAPPFDVELIHDFEKGQVWNRGEGYIALEPTTAVSLSRPGNPISPLADLSEQPGYRIIPGWGSIQLNATLRVFLRLPTE